MACTMTWTGKHGTGPSQQEGGVGLGTDCPLPSGRPENTEYGSDQASRDRPYPRVCPRAPALHRRPGVLSGRPVHIGI